MGRVLFDTETTGAMTRYQQGIRYDVGISQLAARMEGASKGYSRFTNILVDPVRKYDAGKITATQYNEMVASVGPTGVRWQEGYRARNNVLFGVHQRHVEATRAALKGRPDLLVKESEMVERMTRHLEAGHRLAAWNVDFDLTQLSQAAARANPALRDRWIRQLNLARNKGRIEDMSTPIKKFLFLSAQEAAMDPKFNKEFFTLGHLDPKVRNLVERGKLSLADIDKLDYNRLVEPNKGFKEFFSRRAGRTGDPRISFERYMGLMERRGLWSAKVQSFATGEIFPHIRYSKGWSADIIAHTLAPKGIKGSVLERDVRSIVGNAVQHEAYSDTAFQEIYEKIFRTKARTWTGMWSDIQPRLKRYDIHTPQQLFRRMESAIERKTRSQLYEVARESTRHVDPTWAADLLGKADAGRQLSSGIAGASRSQPETLRKIYSKAAREVSGAWRKFGAKHPRIAFAGKALAVAAIADALIPSRGADLKGVRDPHDNPYLEVDGMVFGPAGRGVARAITDFGSGRSRENDITYGFNRLMSVRASLSLRYP